MDLSQEANVRKCVLFETTGNSNLDWPFYHSKDQCGFFLQDVMVVFKRPVSSGDTNGNIHRQNRIECDTDFRIKRVCRKQETQD